MTDIHACPSTLDPRYHSFSPSAKRHFLEGKAVSPILPYESLSDGREPLENKGRISLSGAQAKLSAVIDGKVFRLTKEGEQGTYIIKPALSYFENKEYSPANENLTMQIASQVYGIETAANAVCFTRDGAQVYVTKRYDVLADGTRIQQEDLASLAGITKDTHGANYKYDALDYVDLAGIIKKYIPAWRIELQKFFSLMLFNFVFSNGDAHAKNFSVIQTTAGDYRLSPAYDLINTLIHVPDDSLFALRKGLYPGWNPQFGASGSDFKKFGTLIGLEERFIRNEIDRFCTDYPKTDTLIENSFMSSSLKEHYADIYKGRIKYWLKY